MKDRGGAAAAGALEQRIGYEFGNRDLLIMALTHSSAVNDAMASYQRLEFLGDRVLALVISEMLIEEFPRAAEGELAQRLTALVRNEACAEVARTLDLGEAIRLGGGEAQSGGRRKAAILGDACEALIGAVYLDGGLEPARRFVVENWREQDARRHEHRPRRQDHAAGMGAGQGSRGPVLRDRRPQRAGSRAALRSRGEGRRPRRRAAAPAARGARPSRTPRPPR